MIHYTLLPPDEMKSLRNEYRTRFFIVLSFFISLAIFIGLLTLIPSYLISSSQEDKAMEEAREWQKNREDNGIDDMEKEIMKSYALARNIMTDEDTVVYSDIIKDLLSHRPKDILISSFDISRAVGTSTPVMLIVQGKAMTRESLISFEEDLERDGSFAKVELPISDLTKSKDVAFSLRLTAK